MSAEKWVTIWGNAPSGVEINPAQYAKDITLRFITKADLGGSKVRLFFSNYCCDESVTLDKVTVALATSSYCIDSANAADITFGGSKTVTLAGGEELHSDAVDFEFKRGDEIAVSVYIKDMAKLTAGVTTSGQVDRRFFCAGDCTHSDELELTSYKPAGFCCLLCGIDAFTASANRAFIAYGDSITAQSWTEQLRSIIEREGVEGVSIIRRAISGSRMLREYKCNMYSNYGPSGFRRFERECAATAGADTVFILHGINDLIHPEPNGENPFRPISDFPTAAEMIEGYRFYINIAKKYGLKVYMGTILPIKNWCTYADFRNEVRVAVNEWIRTTDEIDGFVDFDAQMRNPADADMLYPLYDCGDHLHPSIKGAGKMAELVFDALIK